MRNFTFPLIGLGDIYGGNDPGLYPEAPFYPQSPASTPVAPADDGTYSTDLDPEQIANEAEDYLISTGNTPGTDDNGPPPWVQAPPGYQPFLFPGVILLPPQDGNDYAVVQFPVPQGYDGVINQIANGYNGPGFIPGSGTLIYRITQNNAAIKNFDNILVGFGSYSAQGGVSPISLGGQGIPVYSGDIIALVVNNVAQIGQQTQVYALLGGYFFPTVN